MFFLRGGRGGTSLRQSVAKRLYDSRILNRIGVYRSTNMDSSQ